MIGRLPRSRTVEFVVSKTFPVLLAALAIVIFVSPASSQSSESPAPSPTPLDLPFRIDHAKTLPLTEALDRSAKQISAATTADLNARVAIEDLRQARAAFLPKVTAPLTFTYTSPSLLNTRPREPSFLGADAITVYQALLSASGEIDTSGKLHATLQRNAALVAAAKAGSDVARLDLGQSVVDAYYGLELATAKRRGAKSNLDASLKFEENQRLQLEAGEIAPVDLIRARLQTATRRDELIQAETDERVSEYALQALVGIDPAEAVATDDLLTQMPSPGEITSFSETEVATRAEFAQFDAERRAAEFEVRVAKSDRRPQITYSISSGFITDSLAPGPVKNHAGVQIVTGVTIPIFDWGASRSRETQARLRLQLAENSRLLAQRQFLQVFHTARAQALGAAERINHLRQSLTDADANVVASTARYRAGEATITEVVDAQNALVTLRQALYQAIFDYQTAKSRLARATGK